MQCIRASRLSVFSAIAALLGGCYNEADKTAGPKLRELKPLVLVLNPKPGVSERYTGQQAHIDADPRTDQPTLVAFAQSTFESHLRASLDRNGSDLAFVTFYLGPAIINGQQGTKTFRVVFQKKGGAWTRL